MCTREKNTAAKYGRSKYQSDEKSEVVSEASEVAAVVCCRCLGAKDSCRKRREGSAKEEVDKVSNPTPKVDLSRNQGFPGQSRALKLHAGTIIDRQEDMHTICKGV